MEQKTLSIVIVNYNTRSLILQCLNSIVAQDDAEHEIIVVDNNSEDGSPRAIRDNFPRAVVIENNHNLGYAKAVNRGIERSHGEFVLILNSDIDLRPGALKKSLEFMRKHPDAGIMGCKLLNADGTLQPSCEGFPTLWNIFGESFFLDRIVLTSRIFGGLHMTNFPYDRITKVDRVMGAFLMVRRKALQDIGLMDEQFFFYSEEVDWCYRSWQKGWPVYFFPGAEVIHYGGGSADPVSPALFVERHKNRFLFYKKNHGIFSSLVVRVIAGAGIVLRLVLWSTIAAYAYLRKGPDAAISMRKVVAYWATTKWYAGL